ncbi:MAG: caspase family protein, partial [Tannerella sp.]|nr:caspase family protein [Tannerella sp.]
MKKILFLVLLCSFSPAHARQKGTLYAVIVGVSEYRHISNLVYSHRDALEMYDLLKLQTAPANLKLLTNRQATKDSILSAMNSLFTQTKPEDIVIFYFSGHGT